MTTNLFGRTAAAAMSAAIAALSLQASAAEIGWKASIWGPPRTATEPAAWFMKEVTAKTGGELKFDIVYGKSKPEEALELLKSGAIDAGFVCTTYYGDKTPLSTVVDLPMFAPESLTALGRVQLALSEHPAIEAELRQWNVKMLVPAPLPQYQLMGTRRLAKIEDLKGARIRVSGAMGKILEEYGATISSVSALDAAAALNAKTLDLAALPYPHAMVSFKIHEASRYITDNISLGSQFCYLGVNQRAWNALPSRVQKTMLGLRQAAVTQTESVYARGRAEQLAIFKEKGLEFVAFGTPDRARLLAKAINYWRSWVDEREKQGLKGKEVFEFTQAKIRESGRN